jgi:precorrin-6A synthase
VQALAARHKVPLNHIGGSIKITTGRRLSEDFPIAFDNDSVDGMVIMLDADDAYKKLVDQDIDIYWGAYLGTDDEILIKGKLREVADDIERARKEARRANGWIMDTYLLKRRDGN